MRYTISVALASLLAGPALAEVPRVVTDLPPVHSLVAQVMGDLGEPDLLLGQGADPHSFQLRPSQARALANADLVVWIGPEMTRWLERALEGRKGEELRLMQVAGTHLQDFGEGAAHDHAGHGHDHADEDHDHAGEGTSTRTRATPAKRTITRTRATPTATKRTITANMRATAIRASTPMPGSIPRMRSSG